MATHQIAQPINSQAAVRSQLYALLAEALAFPQEDTALRLLNGDWQGEYADAWSCLDDIQTDEEGIDPGIKFQSVSELQANYSNLFDVTSGTPKVSLLARRYRDTPEQSLWQELLGFYSHFGLDFSAGYAEEQIDHLLTELSFMHYLSFLEAGAEQGTSDFQRGQRDFLKVHLLPFTESFLRAFGELEQADFYADLAAKLARLAADDLRYLELVLEGQSSSTAGS